MRVGTNVLKVLRRKRRARLNLVGGKELVGLQKPFIRTIFQLLQYGMISGKSAGSVTLNSYIGQQRTNVGK